MHTTESMELTISEVGYLWCGYTINEMSRWFLMIFQQSMSDQEMKLMYSHALDVTNEIIKQRESLLTKDGFPIPHGFSDLDINKQASPLFSDRFMLRYLYIGSQLGLDFHSRALAVAAREDVREYLRYCLELTIKLNQQVIELLLNKGLYWRTPALSPPESQEKVHMISYLNGWLGETRPLNSMEITNVYSILDLLMLIEALSTGFAQTAEAAEVKEILGQGYKVARDQISKMSEIFNNEALPIPPSYLAEVTDYEGTVFSDRLMICHIAGLFGSLITLAGSSVGSVMKHDLLLSYTTLNVEAGKFSSDIAQLLIENEWLEKVPGPKKRAMTMQ